MAHTVTPQAGQSLGARLRHVVLNALCGVVFLALTVLAVGIPLLVLLYQAPKQLALWRHGQSQHLRSVRARPADQVHDAELLHVVRELSVAAGIGTPTVMVSDQPIANAFAASTRNGAVVCVTHQAAALLTPRELRAVLAHEIGHVVNRDTRYSLLMAAIYNSLEAGCMVIGYLVGVLMAAGEKRKRDKQAAFALGMAIGWLGCRIGNIAVMVGNRQRELSADRIGAELSGDPLALASALRRLEGADKRVPSERARELALVSPLCVVPALSLRGVSGLLSSHPSISRRVRRLHRSTTPEQRAAYERELAHARWVVERRAAADRHRFAAFLEPQATTDPLGRLAKRERVWGAEYTGALVEQRQQRGRRHLVATGRGRILITDHRIIYLGAKKTEWRYDKLTDFGLDQPESGQALALFAVTNRKKVSGFQPDQSQTLLVIQVAVAAAQGRHEQFLAALRADVQRLDAQRPVIPTQPTGCGRVELSAAEAEVVWDVC
jgi:heat shock protein HtpX